MTVEPPLQQVLGLGQTVPITLLLFLAPGLVGRYLLEERTKGAVPAYRAQNYDDGHLHKLPPYPHHCQPVGQDSGFRDSGIAYSLEWDCLSTTHKWSNLGLVT